MAHAHSLDQIADQLAQELGPLLRIGWISARSADRMSEGAGMMIKLSHGDYDRSPGRSPRRLRVYALALAPGRRITRPGKT